jgi:two-component system response regulator
MKSRTVLLVDDNPDDVALTVRALEKANVENELTVARDGVEAVGLLLGVRKLRPALILLDLKLPKLSGFDVLQRIRSDPATRVLPVVILTSSKEESDVAKSYQLGANGYVRKPIDFSQFVATVQSLALYWLRVNEPPAESAR